MRSQLEGNDVPQANRLERVIARVQSIVRADGSWPDAGPRDRAYYTQAAQILGWLDENQQPTASGRALVDADSPRAGLRQAVIAFEACALGAAWLEHAGASGIAALHGDSALPFLEACSTLSASTAKRRAGTLRHWLHDLHEAAATEPESRARLGSRRRRARPGPPHVRSFLQQPVDTSVPTRMANWCARHGVETFAQLLEYAPHDLLAEKNLGKKSIHLTSAAVADATGMSWEALHALLRSTSHAASTLESGDAMTDTGADAIDWNTAGWVDCRSACPEVLKGVSVARLELPTRMRNFCAAESIETLGELLTLTLAGLLERRNLGRSSVHQTLEAVRAFLQQAAEEGAESLAQPSFEQLPDLFQIVSDEFSLLSPIDRLIVTRRAGFHGDLPTLQELGDTLGVSRERVRQLERRACRRVGSRWWATQARERVLAALPGGARRLEELARDPFFPDADDLGTTLDFILHRVLDDVARVVRVGEQEVVCSADPREVGAALEAMFTATRKLVFPVSEDAVTHLAQRHASAVAPGLAPFFERALLERLSVATTSDGIRRVTGFGHGRDNRILALLEESDAPITIQQLEQEVGRGRLPEAAIYVARGLVALPKHVPDFHLWSRRLVPICVAVMRGEDPGRQWSVSELLDEVSAQAQLPEWMGHWHLASMLRLSGQVRYLGRLRVALEDEAAPEERTYVRDAVSAILRDAGRPLSMADLQAQLRPRQTVDANALSMFLLWAPFVRVDRHAYGLLERDLPGGVQALAEAAELLADELEARQRGLGSAEALSLVRELSADHARWNAAMLLSVVRQAGAFRLNRSGGIGLADWDDERLPTRRQVVLQLVEDGGGRASVAAVQSALESRFGVRPARGPLGLLANAMGLHLAGDELLRDDIAQASVPPPAPELPEPRSLPGFPAIAGPLFIRLLSETPGDFPALRQQAQDYISAFESAHHENEFIDPDEARALALASAKLIDGLDLNASHAAAAVARKLVWAAVRYFVLSDDASSDFAIGGLDDDIAVLNGVATYLDRSDCRVILR